jgi:rod shape-determining protein MreB
VPRDLAIDFGTASTRVVARGRGLIYDQPSIAAVDTRTRDVLALGHDALELVGRTADHVVVVRPLSQGAISDFDMAERMLRSVLAACGVGRMGRLRVLMTVPAAATSIERRALKQAVRGAGASAVFMLESTMAAAIGLDLPINEPMGSVVVDVGAGTCEAGMISLGGVVALKALRIGGHDLDRAIASQVRQRLDLVISESLAEDVKCRLASVDSTAPEVVAEIHGRRTSSGEPAIGEIPSSLVATAVADLAAQMVGGVASCLADAPPELAQDAIFEGIHLIGGGSRLDGFAALLEAGISVPVRVVADPEHVVVEGAGRCLEDLDRLRPLFASADR